MAPRGSRQRTICLSYFRKTKRQKNMTEGKLQITRKCANPASCMDLKGTAEAAFILVQLFIWRSHKSQAGRVGGFSHGPLIPRWLLLQLFLCRIFWDSHKREKVNRIYRKPALIYDPCLGGGVPKAKPLCSVFLPHLLQILIASMLLSCCWQEMQRLCKWASVENSQKVGACL